MKNILPQLKTYNLSPNEFGAIALIRSEASLNEITKAFSPGLLLTNEIYPDLIIEVTTPQGEQAIKAHRYHSSPFSITYVIPTNRCIVFHS